MKNNHKIKKYTITLILFITFLFTLPFTRANSLLGTDKIFVLYSSLAPNSDTVKYHTITKGLFGTNEEIVKADKSQFNGHKKKVFISPDKKLLAITVSPYQNHGNILTYITDINGGTITPPYPGSFISWTPDSSKVLLFLSGNDNEDGKRHVYYLGINSGYGNLGLPAGATSADISKDGEIVYVLTEDGTDNSSMYVRDLSGSDRIVLDGGDDIFAWVRWSPDGSKIAFLKADWEDNTNHKSIKVINYNGTEEEKISGVEWNFPPMWSPDGSKIAFSYEKNIWEYNIHQKNKNKLTNFDTGNALQPSYSSDGNTIAFSSDFSGTKQIWIAKNGEVVQLTNDVLDKVYPVLP